MHLAALAIVAVFAGGGSYVLYKVTNAIIPLRVTDEQEDIGLDLSQHGESLDDVEAVPVPQRRMLDVA